MSKMDLSELYEEVQANFKPQSQAHVAKGVELERIKENMARLTGRVQAQVVEKASEVAAPSGCRVPNCPLCKKR